MISYKEKYIDIHDKYKTLRKHCDDLEKDTRVLTNYLLRIKRKCEAENLWLMASMDPHKSLVESEQQGPMISKMFKMVINLKRKIK